MPTKHYLTQFLLQEDNCGNRDTNDPAQRRMLATVPRDPIQLTRSQNSFHPRCGRSRSRYNGISMDGRPRKFPEKEVLRAEEVVGRIWHEHTVSHAYTPDHTGAPG